ncbi:uncharacterized protein MONOS_18279 [Monocercomonoides exilis]|uniref:uncharacterized protein n=1 Tax=Monocercomonoides exilis TaxID=2049356 RepID=UPI003559CFD1|nr:hypothetical protein MONOS_18279 [Monocercomonoides exilis]
MQTYAYSIRMIKISLFSECNTFLKMQEIGNAKHFTELFSELEHCNEDEQRKKIREMNLLKEEMVEEEFASVFSEELFKKIVKMLEEKKISVDCIILLLKNVGYCSALKDLSRSNFYRSELNNKVQKMIIEEEKKKERKNEKLLADLSECYLFLSRFFSKEMISICVPCVLKTALKKEESKEAQKEVEMALLTLRNVKYNDIGKELYLNEIKEIILHHQQHRNLTRLSYQSAWEFLICRLDNDKSLKKVFVNELHFAREAARELEELSKRVDWKRGKETKEEYILLRWFRTFDYFFRECKLWNEEFVGLINSIVQIFGATKDNYQYICIRCIDALISAIKVRIAIVEGLLKCRAIDTFLEAIQHPTLDECVVCKSLEVFIEILKRLKEEVDEEIEKAKRKSTKRKVFEKMEEEGYEDAIACFHGILHFLYRKYYCGLSSNISDYFVNV